MVFAQTNSHSLSNNCRSINSKLSAHKKGVGVSCKYINKDGDVKEFKSVYNDMFMYRINRKPKLKMLLRDETFRSITIKEMTSRIQSYLIAYHYSLLNDMETNPFLTLEEIFSLSDEYHKEMSLFMNRGYSKFHASLLVWSTTTGEMRNHQSTAAHLDGNISHEIESLSLYSRESNDTSIKKSNLVMSDTDGYLYFPIDGLVIRYKCGEHLIHCNLKHTIHLSDNTRNKINWSRVHGPK